VPALVAILIAGGAIAEGLVAYGFGRFLGRVRPDLLGLNVPGSPAHPSSGPTHRPVAEEQHVHTG